jgi:thiol:disulfide interchange protein DsbD
MLRRFLVFASLILSLFSSLAAAQEYLPVDQAFAVEVKSATSERVTLRWRVAEGYYLYRSKIDAAAASGSPVALGGPVLPAGETIEDRYFGKSQVYREDFTTDVPLDDGGAVPARFDLDVAYQGCAKDGICYPPRTETLTVSLAGAATPPEAPEQDRLAALLGDGSLGWTLSAFFGAGLLLAFSPCVLPMLPILSGVIVGTGGQGRARGFVLSLAYVLPMAAAYAALGTVAGLMGANLQAYLQSPWILGPFAGLFVLLAAAMFGFFTLQLPDSLQSRISNLSQNLPGGQVAGVAAMGVLSALIAGPCMTAPLAAGLLYIGQTGDALVGGLALFALGLGMGVPLVVIGTLGARVLPRAGTWMSAVQVAFGFVFLALAVWMLERVLADVVIVLLWGLLAGAVAVTLGAVEPLRDRPGPGRRLAKTVALAVGLWSAAMILGAAAGSTSPLQPLSFLTDASDRAEAPTNDTEDTDRAGEYVSLQGLSAVEAQLAKAKAAGEPVVVDFYADWCISCKVIEKQVFGDPEVAEAMAGVRRLRPDVTANTQSDRALQEKFDVVGPPTLLFIDANGNEQRNQRIVGEVGPDEFMKRLHQAFGDT